MNNRTLLGLSLLTLSVSTGQAAMAADEKGEGFIEGSSLTILNRNLYFNRDFRKGQSSSSGNGYSEEWAHGVIGRFESGFTEGTIGFGVDAFAMLGLKLDTGDGRSGAGGSVDVLPYNSLGQAEDNYSKLGGAVKTRLAAPRSFDNNIWSGKVGIQFGAHTVLVGLQRNNGDDDFDYLRQSDSIYLDNSIQYSDFNSPKEKSWQVRYDLDMEPFGVPGLSFMTRYAQGWDADYSDANEVYMRRDDNGDPLTNQKRWERDIEAKYVVQSGSLKDMSFRIRQATTRATDFESDLDEFRLIVEYPLEVL
ncbi:OprD family porin [Pseudomonas sp. MDMC_285]|nr:OprD family porin [Pseudomonas sp. MDMC_285]